MSKLKIISTQAKSILVKTGLPGADWVINPYRGCTFGCQYCYAAQFGRWWHPGKEWGTYLDVKTNAPALLLRQLQAKSKRSKKKDFGFIFIGSATDPYLGQEANFKLTRQCLQVLADFAYQGGIGLQTKSPLVTRDLDLLKRLKKVSVGFTVTSLNDEVSRFLEGAAPPVTSRLNALKKLREAGIPTYAFIGPILPHFVTDKTTFNLLLDALQAVGVREVWFEHLNLAPQTKNRLFSYLNRTAPELILAFKQADTAEYRKNLEQVIQECLKGRDMKMGLGRVIHHRSLSN